MTDYGVTDAGFVIKPQTVIQSGIVSAASAAPALGPDLDYSTASPLGQHIGLFSASLAELWELAALVYASADPEAARGVALDNVCSLTGTTRPGARPSTVALTLNLDDGTTVTAGSFVSPAGRPTVVFTIDADVSNTSGITANFPALATCTVDGPINVAAGQMTVIGSVTAGWNSVTNAEDAVPGRYVADNAELRALRTEQLFQRGGSTAGAIQADVLSVSGVLSVIVLNNKTDSGDANGLPPHSYEVILDDGEIPAADDDEIAQAIFDTAPAGIAGGGTSSGSAFDAAGNEYAVPFSRVERKNVYIDLTLEVNSHFPTNGLDLVKAAIVAAGNAYNPGDTAVALYLRSQAFTVAGVIDVPTFTLGWTPSPVGTSNLVVSFRQRNTFDTSRITAALA